ncbi:MAG: hypothetical protein HZA49_09925 [Planctomycetes bacterium]|nr:hypothetical protein [Planctomycetota bacterium]
MERIWYILLALGACVVALVLFIFGYRAIRYYKTKDKWLREFWISVAIVLAFLTSVTCNKKTSETPRVTCYEVSILQQQTSRSIEELRSIWQTLNATKTQVASSKLEPEVSQLIDRIQEEQKFSQALKLTLNALFSLRMGHINRTHSGSTCYDMPMASVRRMETLDALEEQYALLDKMRKEGKIDYTICNKVKNTILSDYENLIADWNTQKSVLDGLSQDDKNKVVDLIMELSGVETKEQGQLESTPEWKAMIEQWKTASKLRDKPRTLKEVEESRKETNTKLNDLQKLVVKGLISISLMDLIRNEFEQLQALHPVDVTCYMNGSAVPKTEMQMLRIRLPLIEKMIRENKIDEWIYYNVIRKLKSDVKILASTDNERFLWYKKGFNLKDEEIENRIKVENDMIKKAQELIDKIEKDGNYR